MLKSELKSWLKIEIRNPEQYFSVKYGNLYHVNCNVRYRATMVNRTLLIVAGSKVGGFSSLPGELVMHCLSVT